MSIGRWLILRRVVELNGRNRGPVFADKDGFVWTSVTINEMFHEGLEYIYEHHKALFPFGITSADDVRLHYGIYRSFRRGSDSRAISQSLSKRARHTSLQSVVERQEVSRDQGLGVNGNTLGRPESLGRMFPSLHPGYVTVEDIKRGDKKLYLQCRCQTHGCKTSLVEAWLHVTSLYIFLCALPTWNDTTIGDWYIWIKSGVDQWSPRSQT